MLAALRRQRILDELQLNGSVLISSLAEHLEVSEMTIRRDLAGLEGDGLLERVHGGAVQAQRGVEEPGFDKKVLCQQQEKELIAGVAAGMGSVSAMSRCRFSTPARRTRRASTCPRLSARAFGCGADHGGERTCGPGLPGNGPAAKRRPARRPRRRPAGQAWS